MRTVRVNAASKSYDVLIGKMPLKLWVKRQKSSAPAH